MDILNSAWLLDMLKKAGGKPADQVLALFSCVENWMAAPGIREQFVERIHADTLLLHECPALAQRLQELASAAGVQQPPVFVSQVLMLLQGAIAEEIRSPASGAFHAAREAVRALLLTARGGRNLNGKRYALLAGGAVAALVMLAGVQVLGERDHGSFHQKTQAALQRGTAVVTAQISPDVVEEVLTLQKQIDAGICPSPQLLTMPQDQMATYMDLIHFRRSDHPGADSARLRDFLAWYNQNRSWECYYPPANGHTSVAWMG
jgi:hypothetical protein